MFWWLLLPMFWALVLLLIAGVLAVWLGPRLAHGRGGLPGSRWLWSVATVIAVPVLFVPAVVVVHATTGPFRFGRFVYAEAGAIGDRRIREELPPGATDLVILRRLNGYEATYAVTAEALERHLDAVWAAADPRRTMNERGEAFAGFRRELAGLGAYPPDRAELFIGPIEPDGGGFHLWFDRRTGRAWQDSGYW